MADPVERRKHLPVIDVNRADFSRNSGKNGGYFSETGNVPQVSAVTSGHFQACFARRAKTRNPKLNSCNGERKPQISGFFSLDLLTICNFGEFANGTFFNPCNLWLI
ncbi:MAG: hypothetical protein WCO57_03725 [Verrucomicrobiota bacterium]